MLYDSVGEQLYCRANEVSTHTSLPAAACEVNWSYCVRPQEIPDDG
jgi:hypothetical protein